MTTRNSLSTEPAHEASLIKSMLIGGGIALIVILFFVLPVNEPKPEWSKFWMIRPLIITPLAGACGGACVYFIGGMQNQRRGKRIVVTIVSFMVYIIGLWLGIILGLDGTLWN